MSPSQTPNAPFPRQWLMTDERIGAALLDIIGAMPRGAGVVFRHHSLTLTDRETLGRAVASICAERGLLLSVSRDAVLAGGLGAVMIHNPPEGVVGVPFSLSVHDEAEAAHAKRRGAALAFVAPVYATRSHPAAAALGVERAGELLALCECPGIALGGMSEANFAPLAAHGFHGWAAIDAWLGIGDPRT